VTSPDIQPALPARVARLRRALIKTIPRIPNDRASLDHMERKHLGELLIDYFSWRSRYVGARPRDIVIEAGADATPLWAAHRVGIDAFLDKVRQGKDLTAHLSLLPHSEGYAPAVRADPAARWADKDFLLNATNYHHFHLGTKVEARGHIERTNNLLFAEVTRETFRAIGLFDHDVFKLGSTENLRYLTVRDSLTRQQAPQGMVVIEAVLATSGHPVHVVNYAAHCARLIRDTDPVLDDRTTVDRLYQQAGRSPPDKVRAEWMLVHLDLCIHDRGGDTTFCIAKGWN